MIRVDVEQQTPEWYEIRRGVITASHFDSILTPKTMKVSASATGIAHRVVAEWLTGKVEQPPSTRAMEWGILMEPEAVKCYELIRGVEVDRVGFCFLDDDRQVGCSPDGLVGDDGGIEVKCLNAASHVRCLVDRAVPAEFGPQIQGNLWITGRKWWDYVSYHPDMPAEIIRVERDETFIKALGLAVDYVVGLVQGMKTALELRGFTPAAPKSFAPPDPKAFETFIHALVPKGYM